MPLFAFTLLKYLFLVLLYAFLLFALVIIARDVLVRSSSRQGEARLVGVEGKLSGRSFYLSQTTTIGRGEHNSLVLDDEYASSSHALIFRNAEGFLVQDVGSSNGTFINGHLIAQAAPLWSGDTVRIGENSFRFEWEKK